MGCMAALEAARLLAEEDHEKQHAGAAEPELQKLGAW
jgi:thioredoxin reductase (NADPH)